MSGTVVEVGSGVTAVTVGQKCVINPTVDDRHHGHEPCRGCRDGKPNICKHWACYGLCAAGGGLADEIVVDYHSVIPLPDGISLKTAALVEPLAVACHMIRVSGFEKGDKVLVIGAGPIGLALLLLLKGLGAAMVLMSELSASRMQKARDFGADAVIDPTTKLDGQHQNGVLQYIDENTDGGVDLSFDATGLQVTLDTAIAATRPGGTIFNVAIHEKPLTIDPNALTMFEKRYMGGLCYTDDDFFTVLGELASGRLKPDAMITSIVSLENAAEGAFLELINNKENHVKILVQPQVHDRSSTLSLL
jgi:(R,R)-butanediol dehydrogenase/meso-butanediol dehydrogenase/diacetyl reductase